MTIDPIARTILTGAGVAAGIGLAATAIAVIARAGDDRVGPDESKQSVEAFVDQVIEAYDEADKGARLLDTFAFGSTPKDGVLSLGLREYTAPIDRGNGWNRTFFPGTVVNDQDTFASGLVFLRGADANGDDDITRDELVAAVTPFAGGDGKLDRTERRHVLLDAGLGDVLPNGVAHDPFRATDDEETVATVREAIDATSDRNGVMPAYSTFLEHTPRVEGDDSSRRVSVPVDVEGARYAPEGGGIGVGAITSSTPFYAGIDDTFGNGDGRVSSEEIGAWVAREAKDPALPTGIVRYDSVQALFDRTRPTIELGRVAQEGVDTKLYYNPDVPQATIDAFYGGDLVGYLDAHTPIGAARGGVQWQPDPEAR